MFTAVSPEDALAGKYPEWIVFVITHNPDGPADLMPAGWCMVCSNEPLLLAVAIGHQRHTATLIERTGEFNLGWAGVGQHQVVTFCGTHSGRQLNKLAALRLRTAPAQVNRAPLIEGCARILECKLRHAYPTGDHTVFVGEPQAAHVADPPIANMVNFGGWYAAAQAVED